jgi:HAD superfamily hydrolase (TIGR01662 family)
VLILINLSIFDHDMTIVDSSYAILNAINRVAEEVGNPPVTHETVMKFAAVPMRDFIEGIWGECRQSWLDLYREKVEPLEYEQIRPFPEVPRVLTKLREMGIFLAVASNRRNPRAAMDKSKTSRYFDMIVGPIDGLPHKPDPGMLDYLMERFGVSRSETIYVGDSDIDIQTGYAAGVRTVGITRGNFTHAQLEELGAWRVVDSMDDLLPIIAEDRDPTDRDPTDRNRSHESALAETKAGG